MSRTLDLLTDGDVHGTVTGYRAGCTTAHCPAPAACRDVYRRYQGDWAFRRRVDAGEHPATMLLAEAAHAEQVRQRDKAAAKAEKRRAAGEHEQREQRKKTAKTGQTAKRPKRVERRERPTPRVGRMAQLREPVAQLHAEGLNDTQIAERLGSNLSTIGAVRNGLGLPRIRRTTTPKREGPSPRALRHEQIRAMNADGKTDRQIADELGVTRSAVYQARVRLGLPLVPAVHEPKRERQPRAVTARPRGIQTHGTHAGYQRGCRCDPCRAANTEYMRAYREKRRAAGAGEHHGTAYGYQLGCRGAGCPSTPSCTAVMLEQDRARRRAAGRPAKHLIDAGPARAHVRDLQAAGMTVQQVADAADVPAATVKSLLFSRGKGRPPVEQLLADRAAAILTVAIPERTAA